MQTYCERKKVHVPLSRDWLLTITHLSVSLESPLDVKMK